ncbi:MAG: hypothetical protein D6705_04430 [Deltaproteobacteria bacterium]|nr:MAG: hypothetical protein D6705_04430 [Deltaproteobacteria bacterium]
MTDPPASEVDGGDAETANAAAAAAASTRPEGVVYRSELDRATARGPAYLLRQLGPEPHRIDGRFVGYRITRLFPDEPGLCSDPCDLHEGDVIVAVNGVRIERPEHLATLFEQLPSMTELRVDRLREGEGQSRTYRILPDPAPTGAP